MAMLPSSGQFNSSMPVAQNVQSMQNAHPAGCNCGCACSQEIQQNVQQQQVQQPPFGTSNLNSVMPQNNQNLMSSSTMMLLTTLNTMMAAVSAMVQATMLMLMNGGSGETTNNISVNSLSESNNTTESTNETSTDNRTEINDTNTSPSGPIDSSGFSQDWSNNLDHVPSGDRQGFSDKVLSIAAKVEMDPDHLMAIFMSESGINPTAVNPGSGATGLIQWLPSTARGHGTSTSALKNMSALEQLDWVEKYMLPYKGRLKTKADAYMAVFSPAFIGKGDNHVAYSRGQGGYEGNKGLDANNDGKITNAELGVRLDKYLA